MTTTAAPRPGVAARAGRVLACLLALVMLSGCAGWSARLTIVPSHRAFDLDLIFAGRADQTGPEIKDDCAAFAKGGAEAHLSAHDGNVYCEIKMPVAFKSDQTFVTHTEDQWVFHMTAKNLYAFLASRLGDGFTHQYPNGIAQNEIDDFHMRVDFPEPVVEHNAGSRVEGNSVIWDDAKPLFTDEGLKAASGTDQTWKWIVAPAVILGGLAALGGLLYRLLAGSGGPGGTRTWPPEHVVTWWERNARRWRDGVRQRPGGPDGSGPAR